MQLGFLMMKHPKYILLTLFLILAQKGIGQVSALEKDFFMEGSYQYGYLLSHKDYLAFFIHEPVQSFQVAFGKVVSGNKAWHQVFNYPSFGMGYYQGSLGNDQIYGHLHSLYFFVDRYYFDVNGRFNIGNRLDLGLAYATRFYDQYTNPYNLALGSRYNVYARLCFEASYWATSQVRILAGAGFSHTSNGSFRKPNAGMNYFTTSASVQYHFREMPKRPRQTFVDTDSAKNEFIVLTSIGRKNISRFDNKIFPLYSVNLAYNRKLYISRYVGLNLYLSYDPSIVEKIHLVKADSVVTGNDQLRVAINASYEIRMGNLSFVFQPGIYLKNKIDVANNICNRLGMRYYTNWGLVAALTLNAHWAAKADVVEWGIGYRFKN